MSESEHTTAIWRTHGWREAAASASLGNAADWERRKAREAVHKAWSLWPWGYPYFLEGISALPKAGPPHIPPLPELLGHHTPLIGLPAALSPS